VTTEEYSVSSDNLIERVKELLHEGSVTRIIVKNEKGTVLSCSKECNHGAHAKKGELACGWER
jgi:hypothetical protein